MKPRVETVDTIERERERERETDREWPNQGVLPANFIQNLQDEKESLTLVWDEGTAALTEVCDEGKAALSVVCDDKCDVDDDCVEGNTCTEGRGSDGGGSGVDEEEEDYATATTVKLLLKMFLSNFYFLGSI